jgi:hypothetical protein
VHFWRSLPFLERLKTHVQILRFPSTGGCSVGGDGQSGAHAAYRCVIPEPIYSLSLSPSLSPPFSLTLPRNSLFLSIAATVPYSPPYPQPAPPHRTAPSSSFSVSTAPHHGGCTMASGQGAQISVRRLGWGRRRWRGDGPANRERGAPFLFPISRQWLHGIRAARDLGRQLGWQRWRWCGGGPTSRD